MTLHHILPGKGAGNTYLGHSLVKVLLLCRYAVGIFYNPNQLSLPWLLIKVVVEGFIVTFPTVFYFYQDIISSWLDVGVSP